MSRETLALLRTAQPEIDAMHPESAGKGDTGAITPDLPPCAGLETLTPPRPLRYAQIWPRAAGQAMSAIRRFCLGCVGGVRADVAQCVATESNSTVCSIHPFLRRTFGKSRRAGALRAIRLECHRCIGLSMSANDKSLIVNCTSKSCALWPFRFGCSPAAAERRGHDVDPE